VVSGVRERGRRDTARAVQRAAIGLVAANGLASVTVGDIAAAAGVSRRTFFNHFPTKTAALFDPDPDDADVLAQLLDDVGTEAEIWPSLRDVGYNFTAQHQDVSAVRRQLIATDPDLAQYHRMAHRHVTEQFVGWTQRRLPEDVLRATVLGETAGAVLVSAFHAWPPGSPYATYLDLIERGFATVQPAY
jgi:TetR/AcrR family transcriptional regulator, regulator of mycofactocin system